MKDRLAFDTVQTYRKVDSNGNLHVDFCPITKTQVAPYFGDEIPGWQRAGLDPRRIYRGYRPGEELAKPETVASLNGIPIQLNHHADYPDAPARQTRIGSTGTDAVYDAPYLRNSLHFQDQRAIDLIEAGAMKELSMGYAYTPILKPGTTPEGEAYDFLMTDIRANHVALVEEGRAGADVLVLDFKPANLTTTLENSNMPNLTDPQDVAAKALEVAQSAVEIQPPQAPAPEEAAQPVPELAPAEDPAVGTDEGEGDDIIARLQAKGVLPEELEQLKALVLQQNAQPAADEDETETAEDEDETDAEDEDETEEKQAADEDETAEDDDDELLEKAGLKDASDEIKAAFLKGVHANDEPDEAADEDEEKLTEDSVRRMIRANDLKHLAVAECRDVLGKRYAQAYDSAGAVYQHACRILGMKGVKKSQAKVAYRAYVAATNKTAKVMAMDSRATADLANDPVASILANVNKGVL